MLHGKEIEPQEEGEERDAFDLYLCIPVLEEAEMEREGVGAETLRVSGCDAEQSQHGWRQRSAFLLLADGSTAGREYQGIHHLVPLRHGDVPR